MAPLGKIAILGIAAFAIASSAAPLAGIPTDDEVMDLYERSAEVLNDNGWPAPVLKPRSASPGRGREKSRDRGHGRDHSWGRDRSREKSPGGGHGGGHGGGRGGIKGGRGGHSGGGGRGGGSNGGNHNGGGGGHGGHAGGGGDRGGHGRGGRGGGSNGGGGGQHIGNKGNVKETGHGRGRDRDWGKKWGHHDNGRDRSRDRNWSKNRGQSEDRGRGHKNDRETISNSEVANRVLATLDFAPFSLGIVVTLPPSPIPGIPSTLSLDPITGFAHGGYSFTIDVGTSVSRPPGSSGRWPLEEFQWRRSRGDAVANLGGRGYGWKLVRMAGGPPPGADQQWKRAGFAAGAHRGSDGAEVVAVWSEMGYSMSKALRFAFLGTGLTGLLGERWAIMAVMTAMGLFERERRSRQRRRF
ncbi:hypothetical protein BN1723_007139 [Verticillium longisporum]|uniref:Uncharacterized protein n=1 Tax=Verticillium longisporum TaxID=100787 RepID=A0A0G4NJM0_VERLO|nr:hypothetical protein BN1723_007139 [Verticillium longisporum]